PITTTESKGSAPPRAAPLRVSVHELCTNAPAPRSGGAGLRGLCHVVAERRLGCEHSLVVLSGVAYVDDDVACRVDSQSRMLNRQADPSEVRQGDVSDCPCGYKPVLRHRRLLICPDDELQAGERCRHAHAAKSRSSATVGCLSSQMTSFRKGVGPLAL